MGHDAGSRLDIELAIGMLEMAQSSTQLFSGDGTISAAWSSRRRRGVRVSMVSTIASPPMAVGRSASPGRQRVELQELAPSIAPTRRAMTPARIRAEPVDEE